MLVPSTPFLTALMEDDRLAGAAEDMVGQIAWIGTGAHQFVGHSVWHYDGGCRQWLRARRDTVSHEFSATAPASTPFEAEAPA